MSIISIKKFNGIAPRYAKRKLHPSFAQEALNCDLWSNEVRSLRSSVIVDVPGKEGDIQTIHKLGPLFLHWNEDVDVVRSPLSSSDSDRIYYSGHYGIKSTNLTLASNGAGTNYPLDWYRLGLPAPDNAPALSVTGGSGTTITRDYVYTYVTAWGEESAPSPHVTITGFVDGSWDLSVMDIAPLNTGTITNIAIGGGVATFTVSAAHFLETGDYVNFSNIVGTGDLPDTFNNANPLPVTRLTATTFSVALSPSGTYTSGGTWTREANLQVTNMTKRIYRTVSGKFRFVTEIPVAQTTHNDTLDDTLLGEELPSIDWTSPPQDIKGLIGLTNGVIAGFKGNTLYLSEPFMPHAFPTGYDQNFSYEIVGLATVGSTIIVTTKGNPYIVTGNDPAFMGADELDFFQACVSKRSIVSIKNGMIYACPDGLAYISSSGAPSIITRNWLKEIDWREYNPSSMNAVVHDDRYYVFFEGGLDNDGGASRRGALVFDPSEPDSTLTVLSVYATAAYNHLEDGNLYLVDGDFIVNFGKGGGFITAQWKSKRFILGTQTTMQAAQVKFSAAGGIALVDKPAEIAKVVAFLDAKDNSVNGSFGGHAVGEFAVGSGPYIDTTKDISGSSLSATFKLYVNGELHYEQPLTDSRPFRLPGGYNADEYEIELSGSGMNFHEVTIAESISDLQKA